MGGGKRNKHKNLYKEQKKTNTAVKDSGKVPETQEGGDFAKACLETQVRAEKANATVKSEVTYVPDSDEEFMETTKCVEKKVESFEVKKEAENSSITAEDEDTKKLKNNLEGGVRGKGKKQHFSYGDRNNREDGKYQAYGNQNNHLDRKSRQSDNLSYSDFKQLDRTKNSTEEPMEISQWDEDETSLAIVNEKKKVEDDADKDHFKDDSGKRNDRRRSWGRVGNPSTIDEPKNQCGDYFSNPDQEWNRSRQFSGSSQSTQYRKKSGDRKSYQGNFFKELIKEKSIKDRRSYGRGNDEGKSGRYRSDSFGSKDRRSTSKPRELDYDYWNKNLRYSAREEGTNVNERFGDLFCARDEYSLAHCVAEDMNMGSGIATTFRSMFKRVDELLEQRVTQGGVAVLPIHNRYIYYLVTKRKSSGKPTYVTLFRSLCAMRKHIEENGVTKLAMPRIGCGLDGLEWSEVKSMLQYIFNAVNVDIIIYNFQQESASPMPSYPKKKCPVKNVLKKVVDIEEYTIILYPCSVERYISDEMRELDKKFNIVRPYENAKRTLGSVIRTEYRQHLYLIYGIVVREKPDDLLNYQHFQTCIAEINKLNKKLASNDRYVYVAMQGFEEKRDNLIVSKLVNLMRNTFTNMYVYICWPKELEHLAPRDIDYS